MAVAEAVVAVAAVGCQSEQPWGLAERLCLAPWAVPPIVGCEKERRLMYVGVAAVGEGGVGSWVSGGQRWKRLWGRWGVLF